MLWSLIFVIPAVAFCDGSISILSSKNTNQGTPSIGDSHFSFQHLENTEIQGPSPIDVKKMDVDSCSSACVKDGNCNAFTLNEGQCSHYATLEGLKNRTGVLTGVITARRKFNISTTDTMPDPIKNLLQIVSSVKGADLCEKLCDSKVACLTFIYLTNTSCYLVGKSDIEFSKNPGKIAFGKAKNEWIRCFYGKGTSTSNVVKDSQVCNLQSSCEYGWYGGTKSAEKADSKGVFSRCESNSFPCKKNGKYKIQYTDDDGNQAWYVKICCDYDHCNYI